MGFLSKLLVISPHVVFAVKCFQPLRTFHRNNITFSSNLLISIIIYQPENHSLSLLSSRQICTGQWPKRLERVMRGGRLWSCLRGCGKACCLHFPPPPSPKPLQLIRHSPFSCCRQRGFQFYLSAKIYPAVTGRSGSRLSHQKRCGKRDVHPLVSLANSRVFPLHQFALCAHI